MRSAGQSIGFVPTMGSLHKGHLSLIDLAHSQADNVVVTIFVNPTQFAANEDFDAYPRVLERDIALCQTKKVAIVFAQCRCHLPEGYSTLSRRRRSALVLCGLSRPQHFRGVATICLKLFNIIQPDYAIFGQKDAQQCAVICKLVRDLNLNLKILTTAPIVRDPDGLAFSSRNAYLSPSQRTEALTLIAH